MTNEPIEVLREELEASGELGLALGGTANVGGGTGGGAGNAAQGAESAGTGPGRPDLKKGRGRPSEVFPIANQFCTLQGAFWRRWREGWYVFPNELTDPKKEWGKGTYGGFVSVSEESALNYWLSWLQVAHPGKATAHFAKAIMDFCKSPRYCEVNEKLEIPCFLDGRKGAGGWMVLGNRAVNVEALAAGESPESATMPHSPLLFTLERVAFDFDPAAMCPRWEQYLSETFPDEGDKKMLQMAFGYCLVFDTSAEVIFLLYGKAGTGKSTALNVLKALVGRSSYISLTPEECTEKHAVGDMAGAKVNVISELPDKLPKSQASAITALFKKAASGETVKREPKNRAPDYPDITARIVACVNRIPEFGDKSGALYRRYRIILFQSPVAEERKDPALGQKLLEELPGIFNWAVDGLRSLRVEYQGKFPQLGKGATIVEGEKKDANNVAEWLVEIVEKAEGEKSVFAKELWEEYKAAIHEEQGEDAPVMQYRNFCREVRCCFEIGPVIKARDPGDWKKKRAVFVGIRRKGAGIAEDDGVVLDDAGGAVGGGAGEETAGRTLWEEEDL